MKIISIIWNQQVVLVINTKAMIKKTFRYLNNKVYQVIKVCTGCTILYKTCWYKSFFVSYNHDIYPDNVWYREHEARNYDIINLGSSSGKWAFDYTGTGVKGMNWAQQPQTLYEDFELLRHYHSILRNGGYVLITIMPFTGINKATGVLDAMKYLKIDTQGEPIQPYKIEEAKRYMVWPILFGKPAVKAIARYLLGREKKQKRTPNSQLDYNTMSEAQLKSDAKGWINAWKWQFSIENIEAPLTNENIKGREYRVELMRKLIDFCKERAYQPIYVIPPVSAFLAREFTPRFRELYIYDYIREVNREIPLLDYSNDEKLKESDLYFNSFFMNRKGRQIFTKRVLYDLNII